MECFIPRKKDIIPIQRKVHLIGKGTITINNKTYQCSDDDNIVIVDIGSVIRQTFSKATVYINQELVTSNSSFTLNETVIDDIWIYLSVLANYDGDDLRVLLFLQEGNTWRTREECEITYYGNVGVTGSSLRFNNSSYNFTSSTKNKIKAQVGDLLECYAGRWYTGGSDYEYSTILYYNNIETSCFLGYRYIPIFGNLTAQGFFDVGINQSYEWVKITT